MPELTEKQKAILAKMQTHSRRALYALPRDGAKPYNPKWNLINRLESQLGLDWQEICAELALIRYEFLQSAGISEPQARKLSGWDKRDPNRKRLLS